MKPVKEMLQDRIKEAAERFARMTKSQKDTALQIVMSPGLLEEKLLDPTVPRILKLAAIICIKDLAATGLQVVAGADENYSRVIANDLEKARENGEIVIDSEGLPMATDQILNKPQNRRPI